MSVIARNFIIKPEHVKGSKIAIIPPGDFLPLAGILTWGEKGRFIHDEQEYIIIRGVISRGLLVSLQESLSEGLDVLSIAALEEMEIYALYGGQDDQELLYLIYEQFGIDLSGSYDSGDVDEEGEPIMMPWIRTVTMAGE